MGGRHAYQLPHQPPRPDAITDVDSVEAIERAIQAGGPGWYHVDEIRQDLLPSGHTTRRWGVGIKRPDGAVTIEQDPWEAGCGRLGSKTPMS